MAAAGQRRNATSGATRRRSPPAGTGTGDAIAGFRTDCDAGGVITFRQFVSAPEFYSERGNSGPDFPTETQWPIETGLRQRSNFNLTGAHSLRLGILLPNSELRHELEPQRTESA